MTRVQAPDQKPLWDPQVFGNRTRISNSTSVLPCELLSPAGTFHQLPNGAQTTLKGNSPACGSPRIRSTPLLGCLSLSPPHQWPSCPVSASVTLPGQDGHQCWAGPCHTGLAWVHPISNPLVWTAQSIQINEPSKPCQAGETNAGKPGKVGESGFNYYLRLSCMHTLHSCAQEPHVFQVLQELGFSEPLHRATGCDINSKSPCSIPD